MSLAVKFVKGSTSEVEGYGMPYGGLHNGRDLAGEFFDKDTQFAFGWGKERPLLYGHGLESGTELEPIGRIKSWENTDKGVWVRGQLDASNEYFEAIQELINAKKLFFSSGAMQHLVRTEKSTGRIKVWPWVEMSLTPSPCNLLATAGAVEEHCKAVGLPTEGLKAMAAALTEDESHAGLKAGGLSPTAAPSDDTLPESYYLHTDATKSLGRYRDDTGTVDPSLLDTAVREVDDSELPEDAKVKALAKARAISREHGYSAVTTVVSTEPLKAVWTTAYVDSLPDSCFLYIEPGGKKDSGGKTTPRSNRHFEYKNKDGVIDKPHLKNSLARIPDSSLPADIKQRVAAKARRIAKANGIDAESAKSYIAVMDLVGKGRGRKAMGSMGGDTDAAGTALDAAITLHQGHMDGSVPTSDASQQKLMNLLTTANTALDSADSGGMDMDEGTDYDGSYEDLIDDLREQLNPRDPWADSGYVSILCTYPTYVICTRYDDGEQTYWRIPYSIDDTGEPVTGTPLEVEQTYVPAKAVLSTGPLSLDAKSVAIAATALEHRTQDLFERRTKDGRVFSSANAKELLGCATQCEATGAKIRGLLDTTSRLEADAAKAAALSSPEGRERRLRLLEMAMG